jgi:hypothetical protein
MKKIDDFKMLSFELDALCCRGCGTAFTHCYVWDEVGDRVELMRVCSEPDSRCPVCGEEGRIGWLLTRDGDSVDLALIVERRRVLQALENSCGVKTARMLVKL